MGSAPWRISQMETFGVSRPARAIAYWIKIKSVNYLTGGRAKGAI
jgi:hypothetical protein